MSIEWIIFLVILCLGILSASSLCIVTIIGDLKEWARDRKEEEDGFIG